MENWIHKLFWTVVCSAILLTSSKSQETRAQHNTRRKLPTVIITREHLRQRPPFYGAPGDTAAEFIVSAGLDTSKSSAVRIRKLGPQRKESTHGPKAPSHVTNGANISTLNDFSRTNNNHPEFRYRTPNFGAPVQTNPAVYPQNLQRRQDIRENQQFPNRPSYLPDRNLNRVPPRYVPPIFVPNFQQHGSINSNFGRPIQGYPVIIDTNLENANTQGNGFDYRYNKPQENRYNTEFTGNKNIYIVESPVLVRKRPEEPKRENPQTISIYRTPTESNNFSNAQPENMKNHSANKIDTPNIEQNTEGISTGTSSKNVIAETPPLVLNNAKPYDIKNHIIRRPSIIVRDEITINEVKQPFDRPRYGPRAIQFEDNSSNSSRYKREASQQKELIDVFTDGKSNSEPRSYNENVFSNFTRTYDDTKSKLFKRKRFGMRNDRNGRNRKLNYLEKTYRPETYHVPETNSTFNLESNSSHHLRIQDENSRHLNSESLDGDVMSFSDFLASPMAEKIRYDRQVLFRNETDNSTSETLPIPNQYNYETFLQNATLLKNIIAARLLHSLLNVDNFSGNSSDARSLDNTSSRSSQDRIVSAEQRQFGIVVSPYESHESISSQASMPVIRILRGKIIPLPELPKELIPIILGTYKQSQTTHTTIDDPKLTDNLIDNAIFSLLQNEGVMHIPRQHQYKSHPLMQRVNRKSPSTNYIGSLKTSDPVPDSSFSFKPAEWSMGPRCDRLTEEICLDDSDYPSSAIMSSIYKDKTKFDLMYAEVKVRESQVEGLSRQQEQAYSLDHYYGPYAQAASGAITRDYGPNGGFVCPSEVHYGRPHRAKTRKGEWKVVVNVGEYTQTLRMEKCLGSGNPCKYVVSHMQSTCSQVYSYHRLLVFSKDLGLHIDLFRVPAACTCHLRPGQGGYTAKYSAPVPYIHRPNPYEEFGGHVETAPSPQMMAEGSSSNGDKKKNSFSSTLWSILGGGKQASAMAQQPQFLDEVQKQIGWTQQLKHFPQLMKQISPNQVLKQLLEDDEEEYSVRRQRIRQKPSRDPINNGGFATHQIPIGVPLPPPPPPRQIIARRPVVSAAPPSSQNNLFGMPSDARSKVISVSTSPEHTTKVFSLTQEPGKNIIRVAQGEKTKNKVVGIGSPTYHQVTAYKILPGMYSPTSGEQSQIPEDSMSPDIPQYSNYDNSDMRAILKPLPPPKGYNKRIVEEEDLIAVEKSEDGEIHTFNLKNVADEEAEEPAVNESDDSRINFSYHPILEYLNM